MAPGQLILSAAEEDQLVIGNQQSPGLTYIEWMVVKGAAARHGVPDWTSVADSSLTMDENVELMRRHGTSNGPTLRELRYNLR